MVYKLGKGTFNIWGMNGLNRLKDVYVETQDILSSRIHEYIGCKTINIRARQGRALKKIWNLVAKDLWIVLLDIIAVNVSYFLALLVRFFGNATYGIFNSSKPQYMVA